MGILHSLIDHSYNLYSLPLVKNNNKGFHVQWVYTKTLTEIDKKIGAMKYYKI